MSGKWIEKEGERGTSKIYEGDENDDQIDHISFHNNENTDGKKFMHIHLKNGDDYKFKEE